MSLKEGNKAPDFTAIDQNGEKVKLNAFTGKKNVVLYFYPKDMTPGCTTEACDFRDNHKAFLKKGALILGVSPDAAPSHEKFKKKFGLPFPLLADEDKTLCKAYGVWKEKSMYGRKYMGVERSTFVIGPDGRFAEVLRKVPPKGPAASLLAGLL